MASVYDHNDSKKLRSLPVLFSGLCIVLVLWFFALYPLMPTTLLGWGITILSGVVIFFWVWACIEILVWLERPRRYQIVFKSLGYPIALSLGFGIFVTAYFARDLISHNFSYFFR